MSIWKILEIEPTDNISDIKKAYAKKSKIVHPEEFPKEFQELRNAYKSAISFAKFKNQIIDTTSEVLINENTERHTKLVDENDTAKTETLTFSEIEEKQNTGNNISIDDTSIDPNIFEEIDELIEQDEKNLNDLSTKYIRLADNILNNRVKYINAWNKYFDNTEVKALQHNYTFTKRFLNLFPKYAVLKTQLLQHIREWSYIWTGTDLEKDFKSLLTEKKKIYVDSSSSKNSRRSPFMGLVGVIFMILTTVLRTNMYSKPKTPAYQSNSIYTISNYSMPSVPSYDYKNYVNSNTASILQDIYSRYPELLTSHSPESSAQSSEYVEEYYDDEDSIKYGVYTDEFLITQSDLDNIINSEDPTSTEIDYINNTLIPLFTQKLKDGYTFEQVKRTALCLGVSEEDYNQLLDYINEQNYEEIYLFEHRLEIYSLLFRISHNTIEYWINTP